MTWMNLKGVTLMDRGLTHIEKEACLDYIYVWTLKKPDLEAESGDQRLGSGQLSRISQMVQHLARRKNVRRSSLCIYSIMDIVSNYGIAESRF